MEPPPRSYLLPGSVAVVADSGALSGPGACSDEKRKRIVESGEKSGFGQQSKRHSIIKGALVGGVAAWWAFREQRPRSGEEVPPTSVFLTHREREWTFVPMTEHHDSTTSVEEYLEVFVRLRRSWP